jgi:hypothetical protein
MRHDSQGTNNFFMQCLSAIDEIKTRVYNLI